MPGSIDWPGSLDGAVQAGLPEHGAIGSRRHGHGAIGRNVPNGTGGSVGGLWHNANRVDVR